MGGKPKRASLSRNIKTPHLLDLSRKAEDRLVRIGRSTFLNLQYQKILATRLEENNLKLSLEAEECGRVCEREAETAVNRK
jgi:hypothetical protein